MAVARFRAPGGALWLLFGLSCGLISGITCRIRTSFLGPPVCCCCLTFLWFRGSSGIGRSRWKIREDGVW
jgi:hypothetical protein